MNFDYANRISPYAKTFDFSTAIEIIESELERIPKTDFHAVIGKTLTSQANELCEWAEKFYQDASSKNQVSALYFEMNGFDINPDLWFISGFAYKTDGGLGETYEDSEWLCYHDVSTDTDYVIKGLESVQDAYTDWNCRQSKNGLSQEQETAEEWCLLAVITRFMELMRAAHVLAKETQQTWAHVPVYFTVHDYDLILRSSH